MANYDVLGDIAIIKFNDNVGKEEKIAKAQELMNQYKSIKTVLEKTNKVSGRLRTIKTNFLLGEKKLEALYIESGCKFKLNINSCYFSPRLANERIEVARLIDKSKVKNPSVLVMFSGVAPFPIVIAKHSNVKKIISIELGKDCKKYALENIRLNKLEDRIEHVQGDVKKIIPKLIDKNKINKKDKKQKFDFIVMPRPNLSETFLSDALKVAKKNSIIIYYGFSPESKKDEMIKELEKEARVLKRKIKILNCLEAGDIAPFEHRYRIEIQVLN